MKCEHCDVRLKITHSYSAGSAAKTQTAKCPKCGRKYTAVTILVGSELGASAWAKKLKSTCISVKDKVSSILKSKNP